MGRCLPYSHYVTFDSPKEDGTPFVCIENDKYCYIISERGNEIDKRKTDNYQLLLYWIACDISFSIASDYELKHREKNIDSRRLLFRTKLRLLKKIDPAFEERQRREILKILEKHPFTDGLPNNID